jgi:rhamnosyl/mannosyltransferase
MGGVEQVIDQIARGAAKLDVKSDVLSLSRELSPQVIHMDGYASHIVNLDLQFASTGFSLSAFSCFKRLTKDVDVIHYHFPWPFMDFVHFLTGVKKPTVVTYHSDIVRQRFLLKLYMPLMKIFLSNVNSIVATSPNYLASSDILRKYKNKVRVIPIGLNKFSYPEPSPEILKYWQNKLGGKFFLFVGQCFLKGVCISLNIFKSLVSNS